MAYRRMILAALVVCGAWLALARGEEAPSAEPSVADLAWLEGAWKGTVTGGEWEAVYTSVDGGQIVSANKEFRAGSVAMIEFEHFRMADGKVVMTPYPYGKRSETTFTLTELDRAARRAVFANPEHDFPKTIIYHRAADDQLIIHISGTQRDQLLKLTLDLRLQN